MEDGATLASLTGWIGKLFERRDLQKMGHAQRVADRNLGLGWLYYALGRMIRPATAVVIGSYRGFVPLVLARALADNAEGGQVVFIDPSLADDFWKDAAGVRRYFAEFGVTNITHHLQTTQQFVASPANRDLGPVGLVFVDGFHSAEQARFDFEAFADRLTPGGMILLHDSVWRMSTAIYGPDQHYVHSVVDFVGELKQQPEWQVLDFPFGDGVTAVRRAETPPAPSRRRTAAAAPLTAGVAP
jgi:predicted O-methyltransferase YrrM